MTAEERTEKFTERIRGALSRVQGRTAAEIVARLDLLPYRLPEVREVLRSLRLRRLVTGTPRRGNRGRPATEYRLA